MRKPTNWNKYKSNPTSIFSRLFLLDLLADAYFDLLSDVKFNKPISILEFGCGTGYITKRLCEKFNVEKITLIDSNKKMLDIAKHSLSVLPCKKEFLNKDLFKFKTNQKYDIIHSAGVIEHFEPKKRHKFLTKHAELLKNKGYCIIYSPTPTKNYLFIRKIREFLHLWKFTDEVPLKKELIIKEMKSLGFADLKYNYFWKHWLTEVGILFQKNNSLK